MPKTKSKSKSKALAGRSGIKFDKTLLAVIAAVVIVTGGYLYYKGTHAATNAGWASLLSTNNCPSYLGIPATIQGGSTGNCVKFAQFLLQLGTGKIGTPKEDGAFGPLMDDYIWKFKSQNGLPADGIVGPAAWKKFNACVNDQSPTIAGLWVCPHVPIIGDLNGDTVVNIVDESILNSRMGKKGYTMLQGDLNRDGVINIYDLSILKSAE